MKWILGLLAVVAVVVFVGNQQEEKRKAERRIASLEDEQQQQQQQMEQQLEQNRLRRDEEQKRACPLGFTYRDDSQDCRNDLGCPPSVPNLWGDGRCRDALEPPQVKVVNAWLQDQRDGDSGAKYWDVTFLSLGGAKRLFKC